MNENLLESNIVYEVIHGSRAYGTNVDSSDYDYKGIAIMSDPKYYFGFKSFEQKDSGWSDGCDRVIYDVRKFTRLALTCNPNIIETLFVPDECVIREVGIIVPLIAAKRKFLSKLAAKTFIGYALGQIKRIDGTIAGSGQIKWKQAAHVVRLLEMGLEIISQGEVIVRRPDAERLLEIRAGLVPWEKIRKEAEEKISRIDSLKQSSLLPDIPDYDGVEKMLVSIIQRYLTNK